METVENMEHDKGKSRKDLLMEYQAKKQLYVSFRSFSPSLSLFLP